MIILKNLDKKRCAKKFKTLEFDRLIETKYTYDIVQNLYFTNTIVIYTHININIVIFLLYRQKRRTIHTQTIKHDTNEGNINGMNE